MNMEFIVLSSVSLSSHQMATVFKMFPKVNSNRSKFIQQQRIFFVAFSRINVVFYFLRAILENANSQIAKIRDRVQNISQKVDTMKLNDSHGTAKSVATLSNREFLHRDENKNATTLSNVGTSTRRKVAPTAADIDNNNDNSDKSATNPTQGDTLNQIKAMRRRHTRLSTNISPVSGLYVFHSSIFFLSVCFALTHFRYCLYMHIKCE